MDRELLMVLRAMQKEMSTQETDGQAAPRFWCIMDYRQVPGDEYDSNLAGIYVNGEVYDLDEARGLLIEWDYGETVEKLDENSPLYKDDLLDIFVDQVQEDARLVFSKEESFIVPNTMFLSKQEAKNHLKQNAHHYNEKADTYAMTAWRAPRTKKVFDAIIGIDWEKIIELYDEES